MYTLSVYFHLILVSFWLGGMLFTAAVLVPASRDRMFENRRGAFFSLAGTLYSRISWVVFPLLLLTGITALIGKGYAFGDLFTSWFWGSPYGKTLAGKLHIFGLVLITSAVHDFWLGPRAARLMDKIPDSPLTARYRKASSWIGRLNLLFGLAILWYAITLVR